MHQNTVLNHASISFIYVLVICLIGSQSKSCLLPLSEATRKSLRALHSNRHRELCTRPCTDLTGVHRRACLVKDTPTLVFVGRSPVWHLDRECSLVIERIATFSAYQSSVSIIRLCKTNGQGTHVERPSAAELKLIDLATPQPFIGSPTRR